MQAQQLAFINKIVAGSDGTEYTFIVPSEAAWTAFEDEATMANVTVTPAMLNALFNFLYTGAAVDDKALSSGEW